MKILKTATVSLVIGLSSLSAAFAGGVQSNNASANMSITANSGPGYGAALAGGTVVSTAMTGPTGAQTSVLGLGTAQTVGHATASFNGSGNASASSLHFGNGGLHW